MHLAPSVPRRARLAAACLLIVVSALTATTLHATTAAAATASLPCDIYATGGTPCVTAHSTTRALFASYNGPLYQIQRSSDSSFLNISVRAAGGVANAAPQVSFCAGTTCTITKIYDQTTNHNDLPISPGGTFAGPGPNGADVGANAMALPVTVGGQTVYGVLVTPRHRLPHLGREERGHRFAARGHLHGHLVERGEWRVLLRLRLGRGRRQR
jgi:hypothetical protein